MRRLLTNWMCCGSGMLALSLMLGCAPATEKPAEHGVLAEPPVEETPASTEESSAEMPAEEGAVEDATPVEDAAEERKDEAEAAGADPLNTDSKDPNVKLGEPEDPVNLK